ncbi:hypothetical protein A1QO_04020 [Vibrio genomosp. F10 str. ZF-129]|uniref:Uncharacterized protein n=1 Tax=Vibrio genomosp. F10 str. ZF-129 TaxID=1187848 RepID=A0A1E5BIN2_9VIBR|nr:hypothetical protein A1QO_04020 [Vibrio genomosp. F10 str. ZF-129]
MIAIMLSKAFYKALEEQKCPMFEVSLTPPPCEYIATLVIKSPPTFASRLQPTSINITAKSIEELRISMPDGCEVIQRHPDTHLGIVEYWG